MNCLIVLLICVPLQYALITYRKPAETYVLSLINSFSKKIDLWSNNLFNILREELAEYFPSIKKAESSVKPNNKEFPDSQILTVRSKRPQEVFYRVGQVVVNIKIAYVGIIIGWHAEQDQEPVYEILTDHPAITEYKTNALQSEIIRLEYIQIYHGEARKYFEYFDYHKSQYVLKPWLRIIYPMD